LGSSLLPGGDQLAARDRIIAYMQKYPFKVIDGDELMVVSGIGEWARRLRELRVQFGWWIYSGFTFRDMASENEDEAEAIETMGVRADRIRPDQYVLMRPEIDREAAYRWNQINALRKKKIAIKDKIIEYLRANVGAQITGEELKYLAKDSKEWARRVRELRTEEGWPISTKTSGRPDLPVGVYVLERDRQVAPHDRKIPDAVRVEVLQRDQFRCTKQGCGWHREMLSQDDPRKILELHHRKPHKDGGENTVENLVTLCNVHHDEIHRH
jgi:hypothetical protein